MRRILILCLVLGLVLVPATVLAAGHQGQGKSGALGSGNSSALQTQTEGSETAAGQYQFCARHGLNDVSKSGNGNMLRIRSCIGEGNGDQVRSQARNQTRLRDGSCGNCPNR